MSGRFEMSRAQLSDFQDIMAISQGVYGGLDYLPQVLVLACIPASSFAFFHTFADIILTLELHINK